jgi:hypothetical protein
MEYQDRVYGQVTISNPVILDLIKSQELQKLKGVDQAGYYEPYYPGSKHSRFEHLALPPNLEHQSCIV